MDEIHEASTLIQSAAHEDANIIWGVVIDEAMEDRISITVVATGGQEYQPKEFLYGQRHRVMTQLELGQFLHDVEHVNLCLVFLTQ